MLMISTCDTATPAVAAMASLYCSCAVVSNSSTVMASWTVTCTNNCPHVSPGGQELHILLFTDVPAGQDWQAKNSDDEVS
tara:strand:+ start:18782 stop:19021 length:240 start_codon:yes stop_codon:yes gene_type:complete